MLRPARSLSALLLLVLAPLAAQQAVELPPQQVNIWQHRLGPEQAIHLTGAEIADHRFIGMEYVAFNVIVSANGRPESATPVSGRAQMSDVSPHLEEAKAVILSRSYKPWLVGGVPTTVRIEDYVSLLPPEKYGASVPFPDVGDLSTITMGLKRTACFGSCPDYEVTISGDGTVRFAGNRFVTIPGSHTAHIPQDKVRELLSLFRKADFFSALDTYRGNWTDNPTQVVKLTIGNRAKTVTDYVGTDAGLPLAIRNLEAEIDEAADTARWIATDEATLPSLLAEKWDFSAPTSANLTLYNSLLAVPAEGKRSSINTQLIDHFIAAKAPIYAASVTDTSPICVASADGDLALVRRMVESARSPGPAKPYPQQVLRACLATSARSANARLFQFWVDHGATLKAGPPIIDKYGNPQASLLSDAIFGGNLTLVRRVLDADPDRSVPREKTPLLTWAIDNSRTAQMPQLIAMLVAAGADPNARDWMGQTPLISVSFISEKSMSDTLQALLVAGADIEARDNNGRTPLIAHAFIENVVRDLLAAGADPTAADKKGATALTTAKQFGCAPCAGLIQTALDKRAANAAALNNHL